MARVFLENIASSRFTEATIRRMFELIDAAKTDPHFQKIVYSVVNRSMHGQWKQYLQEIKTFFNWAIQQVDYRRDPYGVELVQDWVATLDRRRGDCDDFTILLGAGSEVLGAPSRIVTVSTVPSREPTHVYVEVHVEGQWVPMDATVSGSTVGWAPMVGITDRKIWTRQSVGLSGIDDGLPVEGLGMDEQSMNWTDDHYRVNGNGKHRRQPESFASDMFEPRIPGNVSDDISKTFAPGQPGSEIAMARRIPSHLIERPTADARAVDRIGGGRHGTQLRIEPNPTPAEVFRTIPRDQVPLVFDPDQWTGLIPTIPGYRDPRYLLPDRTVQEENAMQDLAGLGQLSLEQDAAKIAQPIVDAVKSGEAPSTASFINNLINTGVGIWSQVNAVEIARQQAKAAQAQAAAAQAVAQITPPLPPRPPSAAAEIFGLPWYIPVGAAALLLFGGGLAMLKGGSRYRRNPHARRSRGRRGGFGLGKLLLPGAAIATVMWLTKKKPAAMVATATAAQQAGREDVEARTF